MKRFLQAFLCALMLLVCTIAVQATPINIQSQQVPDFRFSGANLTLRIFLNDRGFITSDGFPKQPGSPANGRWYKEVNCSLVGSTLTIASFTIDSTTDGLDINTATYSAYFYSGNTQLQVYSGFDRFRVPNVISSSSGCSPVGTCATWADLRAFNFTRVTVLDNSTYVKSEIDAKIAVAGGVPATSPFILKTAVPSLSGAQVLASLGTGLLKNTTGTGNLTTAVAGVDYQAPLVFGNLLVGSNLNLSGGSNSVVGSNVTVSLGSNVVTTNQANTWGNFIQIFQAGANHLLVDPTDTTKRMTFDLSNVTTGNTRNVNIPDASSTTVRSSSAGANQFATGISAQGVVSYAQPSFSNISGSVADGQLSANVSLLGPTIDVSGSEITGILKAASFPQLTGDVTTTAGSLGTTIAANIVTDAKIRQSAGLSLLGRAANSTGNIADITAGGDFQILRRNGTSIAFGAIDLSQSAAVGASILSIPNGGTGSATQNFVDLTNNQLNINGNKTFTGITKLGTIATVNEAFWQSTGSSYLMLGMSDSDSGTPSISGNPSLVLQTTRSGGTQGIGLIVNAFSATNIGKSDIYGVYSLTKFTSNMSSGFSAGSVNQHAVRGYAIGSPTSLPLTDANNDGLPDIGVNIYGGWFQGRRTVANIRAVGTQIDGDNTGPDASIFTGSRNTVFNASTNQTSTAHGTAILYSQGFAATNTYAGWFVDANAVSQRVIDLTLSGGTAIQGLWSASSGNATVSTTSGSGGFAELEVVTGDRLNINGSYGTVLYSNKNSIILTSPFTGTPGTNLTITKAPQPLWLANESYIAGNAPVVTLSGFWTCTAGSATLSGSGGAANTETAAGDVLYIHGEYGTVQSATANSITLTAPYVGLNGSSQTLVRYRRYRMAGITASSTFSFDPDALGTAFGGALTAGGNITVLGTGRRFIADMSNGVSTSNRFGFQSISGNTVMSVIPASGATTSAVRAFNNSDVDNAGLGGLIVTAGGVSLESGFTGGGALQPITITLSGAVALRADGNKNVALGGNVAAGTSAVSVVVIPNGTAPTTSPADLVQLFAADVSASSELRVRDEAGNVTTLSPHNFSGIPRGRSEEMAWSFYSERDGKFINVDMLKAIRLLEKLTGERLVYTGKLH